MEWEKSCMDSVVQRKTKIIDKYNWRGKMFHTCIKTNTHIYNEKPDVVFNNKL